MQEVLEQKIINESLQKTSCPKCQTKLSAAKVYFVSHSNDLLVAHALCNNCNTQSMLTISSLGFGLVPIKTDLENKEFDKFKNAKQISYSEILDLHQDLKKEKLWNLLHKKENY